MLIKSDHCTYFVFCDQSTSHLCTCLPRPVRQVESQNKTSDIPRPFYPSLWSPSPWIKYKEAHRSFQKFRFAKEVLFSFPIRTKEGKILITHLMTCISNFFLLVIVSEKRSFLHVSQKIFFTFYALQRSMARLFPIRMTLVNRQCPYVKQNIRWFHFDKRF